MVRATSPRPLVVQAVWPHMLLLPLLLFHTPAVNIIGGLTGRAAELHSSHSHSLALEQCVHAPGP